MPIFGISTQPARASPTHQKQVSSKPSQQATGSSEAGKPGSLNRMRWDCGVENALGFCKNSLHQDASSSTAKTGLLLAPPRISSRLLPKQHTSIQSSSMDSARCMISASHNVCHGLHIERRPESKIKYTAYSGFSTSTCLYCKGSEKKRL